MHSQDRSEGELRPPSSKNRFPLDLADDLTAELRRELFAGLAGILDDLTTPESLRDVATAALEGCIFARLLEALDQKEIALPDDESKVRIERLAESFDRNWDYPEVTLTHEAHRALLGVLAGAGPGAEAVR